MICVICHDAIEATSDACLSCGHHFHGQCIADWLWTKQSCPICRNEPNNVCEDSNSDSEESEYDVDLFMEQQERIKTRRRILNNILRRKSLGSDKNIQMLKEQIDCKKNLLKSSRNQLRIMNKAIAANLIDSRKKEAQLRRMFHCQLENMKRINRHESKDIHSQAKSLEKNMTNVTFAITKLENKVLEYA